MLPVWGYLEGVIFGIYVFFLLKNSFLAILMLISRKPVQRRGTGEKCGFFATCRPSPKRLKVRYTLPSPSEEKCSTTNIVSLNKAEVQSVEISWSKRFLHSLC